MNLYNDVFGQLTMLWGKNNSSGYDLNDANSFECL